MGKRWTVTDGLGEDEYLFAVEANADGTLTLHIPSPDPIVVSRSKVEEIRIVLGAAVGEVDQL